MLLLSQESDFSGNYFTVRKGHINNRAFNKVLLIIIILFIAYGSGRECCKFKH